MTLPVPPISDRPGRVGFHEGRWYYIDHARDACDAYRGILEWRRLPWYCWLIRGRCKRALKRGWKFELER